MDYKGIKIYDKVIIVERTSTTEGGYNWKGRTVNQGYVVDINNKKMLENALNWAKWTKYDESVLEGKRYWDKTVTDAQRKAYDDAKTTVDGVVHEYENGKFSITLDEAAGWSSQGGKLSFWNCIITGPDGHNFLVGINSELLLHLMMATTLVKGVCQEKVWLGRIKGTQVGVFTPEMDDFKQAKLDEEARNLKKTSNYKPGDIVETLTSKELYIGEVYSYADKYETRGSWYHRDNVTVVFDKPKKMHAFISLWKDEEVKFDDSSIDLKATKPAKIVTGHNEEVMLKYRALIKNFAIEYPKLRVECKDNYDDPSPFTYFTENLAIRLTDKLTPEQIKADMLLAIELRNKGNDPKKYNFNETIKLQKEISKEVFDTYTKDRWYSYNYFHNYMKYYKN